MKNTHVSLQGTRSYHDEIAIAPDRSTPIHDLFVELVQILERLKESSRATSGDGSVDRWDDEDYIYLEADLDAIFESEIDINVHDGRFYVRMER